MKGTIKYILLFMLLFIATDVSIGFVMNLVFPKISYGTYGAINKSLNADQQILIFGSSRAKHHYDPAIISKQTGMTCYNTGLGGQGLFYNYALFSEIVKKNKPDIVILDLSPNVIVDPKSYTKLNIFMPYYFNHPSFQEIIKLDPDFNFLKKVFKSYIYNSTLFDLTGSYVMPDKESNGFAGIHAKLDTTNFKPMLLSNKKELDHNKKIYLEKFIHIARGNHIRLICFVSPTYEKFDTHNRIINKLEKITQKNGVEFYDYSDYAETYRKSKYFKDQLHMNVNGVKKYDKEVSKILLNKNIKLKRISD